MSKLEIDLSEIQGELTLTQIIAKRDRTILAMANELAMMQQKLAEYEKQNEGKKEFKTIEGRKDK